MKKTYINLSGIALKAMICLFIGLSASAQDNGGRPSRPAPSAAPAPAPSRPAPQAQAAPQQRGGNFGVTTQQHTNIQPQNNNTGVTQQRGVNGGRPTINYTPQQRSGVNGGRPYYAPRGGYAPGRSGIAPNNAYRSYPRADYGRNRITVRPGGGIYYNNRGYYRSYYAPRLGFSIGVLPYGYYPFSWGSSQYFYSGGLFYQYDNSQYTVVEPPVGAAINTLPDKAQSIVINGIQYYEADGVYYEPITKDDGTVVYQIAGKDGELNTDDGGAAGQQAPPQVGDLVNSLPQNTRSLKINGQKIYVSDDGYYYQDARDQNNNKVYKIVGTPDDPDDQQAPQQ